MSIEPLKEKARNHEQREEWKAALDTYVQAIQRLDDDDQTDIGLYNRVGDIAIRLGQIDRAADHYMQSVDLYAEAELPNNAIAVCKKVIRNIPTRTDVYLRMGQIRASQGFLTDARESFLTYAERTQQEGDLEEAFRALIEFADLAPDDTDVRLALANQLHAHERTEEAVDQLLEARAALIVAGQDEQVGEVEALIAEFAPDTELPDAADVRAQAEQHSASAAFEPDALALEGVEAAFGGEAGEAEAPESEEETAAAPREMEGLETTGMAEKHGSDEESDVDDMAAQAAAAFGGEDVEEAEATEDESVEAPEMAAGEVGEDEEPAEVAEGQDEAVGDADDGLAELAALANAFEGADTVVEVDEPAAATTEAKAEDGGLHDILDDWAADAGEGAVDAEEDLDTDLQLVDFDSEETEDDPAPSASGESMGDDWLTELTVDSREGQGEESGHEEAEGEQLPALAVDVAPAPAEDVEAEYEDDLFEDEVPAASAPAFEDEPSVEADSIPAPAAGGDYVDLGSLVFDEEETEKTTRWFVEMADPTGDDEADFAQMLTQFKAKVAEHLEADDVRAHYDLGTAYREMGLVDEAIAEFQQALRGSGHHLPTHELLGQCFMEKGQYEVAIRSMNKALESPFEVEDELLGIYYYLGRAHEELGNRAPATEFYEKIFALDINFRDVTERLRALR
ncbi:MAG: tetratricopeptide repeat protein [Gemmatimonadetes bacterium]|nr:tetratricopeptide repeat protein [Gemmatimonadota bacterium]